MYKIAIQMISVGITTYIVNLLFRFKFYYFLIKYNTNVDCPFTFLLFFYKPLQRAMKNMKNLIITKKNGETICLCALANYKLNISHFL